MAGTKVQQSEQLRRNEEKWSKTLMEAGWTVLPSIILEKQHALGLDPIDVYILLQLARHWWYSDNPPHPSKASIAQCLGVDPSTVRRHIARMEADGFIKRGARYSKKSLGGKTPTHTISRDLSRQLRLTQKNSLPSAKNSRVKTLHVRTAKNLGWW